MEKSFIVTCTKCRATFDAEGGQIEGLEAYIAECESDARSDAEDYEMADPWCSVEGPLVSDFTRGERPLFDLALALKGGDVAAANAALDRMADILGVEAQELVASARASRMAA